MITVQDKADFEFRPVIGEFLIEEIVSHIRDTEDYHVDHLIFVH